MSVFQSSANTPSLSINVNDIEILYAIHMWKCNEKAETVNVYIKCNNMTGNIKVKKTSYPPVAFYESVSGIMRDVILDTLKDPTEYVAGIRLLDLHSELSDLVNKAGLTWIVENSCHLAPRRRFLYYLAAIIAEHYDVSFYA